MSIFKYLNKRKEEFNQKERLRLEVLEYLATCAKENDAGNYQRVKELCEELIKLIDKL
jgi:hypothetical protein